VTEHDNSGAVGGAVSTASPPRRRLLRKYVTLMVAVVSLPLLAIGAFGIWSSYQDQKTSLIRIQREQAEAAAGKISQFIKDIEGQIGWMNQLVSSATTIEQHRFAARLLLRQVPAITELVQIDENGREQLRVSRLAMDVVGSQADLSRDVRFVEALARKVYYGPVTFRRESEPYMTVALAGPRRDAGVSVAEVNLKLIWDVVSQIKVGKNGRAYVVDAQGRLIAHPDISLVLRNSDFSRLAQVRAARVSDPGAPPEDARITEDAQGRQVLTAHAAIAPLGWLMFVEVPLAEAYAPVYASLLATGLVLLAGLILALLASVMLARKMAKPIGALQTGAARIGAGALDHRIAISTGDELQALGEQFNGMAAQLQQSYATLERKVEERTHQLQLANLAKSRFLAVASHDLRQPLHALGLFVAQLHSSAEPADRSRIIARIDAAVTAMNELFNALLDISKLDADVLKPNLTRFPIEHLLTRLEATFADAASEKALSLRVVPSDAWVYSDSILLERIMLNLASNAVRYTARGGVVIGARRRGNMLRLEVWDSGPGIPEDQRQNIFVEFYQLASPQGGHRSGLGLGLAIVERLCGLLGHRVEMTSVVGRGSRFAILVPLTAAKAEPVEPPVQMRAIEDPCRGKLVVVIDDDPMVLEGMRGLLTTWGCEMVAADSDQAALAALAGHARTPDLVISDYRLQAAQTGIDAIARLRNAYGVAIPAFLISGDTAPERLHEAIASGYHLLHKPVQPMALRATLIRILQSRGNADAGDEANRARGDSSRSSRAIPSRARRP
jgi:signal transduction histidine kinase/DNA-binding NarL/FixJ family response regulator